MTEITLSFTHSCGSIELEKSAFRYTGMDNEVIAVRGKTAGAHGNFGCFQWTPGVKALSILFMKALSLQLRSEATTGPLISGGKGSIAASLDYALDKEPQWICEMFGLDKHGRNLLRRLILRTNPGQKRAGPVSLALNTSEIGENNIKVKIVIDDSSVTDSNVLDRLIIAIQNDQKDYVSSAADSFESVLINFRDEKRNAYWKRQLAQ